MTAPGHRDDRAAPEPGGSATPRPDGSAAADPALATLPDHIRVPHPQRLHPDRADYDLLLTIHADAVRRDVDGYLDPSTGAWVFTAAYLEERDFCCDMGCRHCPWIERP